MTTTIAVGVLLGAAAALPAARLAELTSHRRSEHPGRLPVVLSLLAVAFSAAATARHGLTSTASVLLALVPAGAAAAVDACERRLPDVLTAALATVIALQIAALVVLGNESGARGTWTFAVSATLCLFAKGLFTDAIGWGDVKLAPSLAALLAVHGWQTLHTGLLLWFGLVLLAALHNVARPNPTGIVAYGPALVGATACGIAMTG